MPIAQIGKAKIDTEYITEAVQQSSAAYRNLMLLVLENGIDIASLGTEAIKAMKNYNIANNIRLHDSFEVVAYLSAISKESGRSLLGILYMGPKEQQELLRKIVKDISVDQVTDYKGSIQRPGITEFKVLVPAQKYYSEQSNGAGYLLTFRKRTAMRGDENRYTLQAEYVRGKDGNSEPLFLFSTNVLVWEEYSGNLADCVEKIIRLNPAPKNKKTAAAASVGKKNTNAADLESVKADAVQTDTGGTAYTDIISQLKNGVSGGEVKIENGSSDPKTVNPQSDSHKPLSSPKSKTEKESPKPDNSETKSKAVPKNKTYSIVKCKEDIKEHLSADHKMMKLLTENDEGGEIIMQAVVDKAGAKIYIDRDVYMKYKPFIQKKLKFMK